MNASDARRFFDDLTPILKDAKAYDVKMDRECARRFNVLEYVRTAEIGLSKIIADLFDPNATHGQDASFLRAFLYLLSNEDNCNVDPHWLDLDFKSVFVKQEKEIEIENKRRKIDIYVTIEGESGKYCLAIENKPYADDQPRQLADYLKYLAAEYDNDKYFLVYLPSRGQRPSESSLPRREYTEWKGRFKIMAYYNEPDFKGRESESTDDLAHYRISFSLVDWFSECRNSCGVNRLRSFFLDAKLFCEKEFGGQEMKLDCEERILMKYLFSNSEHIETAYSICEIWPVLTGEVFKKFQEKLCPLVEKSVKDKLKEIGSSAANIEVDVTEGNQPHIKNLSITRNNWKELDVGNKKKWLAIDSRIGCWLEIQKNGVVLGVGLPIDEPKIVKREKNRIARLKCRLNSDAKLKRLGFKSNPNQPWYLSCKDPMTRFQYWNKHIPSLHKEIESDSEQNEFARYFVDEMVALAAAAIPTIDEFESNDNQLGDSD